MKKILTFLMFAFMFVNMTNLQAQIPTASPFPVDVELVSPTANAQSLAYGQPDFGDNLTQTIVGEVVWAYDAVDSLACDTILVTDLTGKIALIRRGACEFGRKTLNAEIAGAIGVIIVNHFDDDTQSDTDLVQMGGGVFGGEVTIPSAFVSRATGALIDDLLQAGETVEVSYTVSFSLNPAGPAAYGTPLSQGSSVVPQFEVFNPSAVDPVIDAVGTAVITDPSGVETTLTANIATIDPETSGIFAFEDYVPAEIGEYSIVFTNSLNEDVLMRAFAMTDGIFQADNGEIVPNTNGTIEPSEEAFLENGLTYHVGNYYTTGPNPGAISHVSFMISNPEELRTGESEADDFEVVLYDTDIDGDGVVNISETSTTFDGLVPVGNALYTLKDSDQPFDLLTVQFDTPVQLKPSHQYIVMIKYNGANAAVGIPPKYAFAGNEAYVYELAEGPALGGDITFNAMLEPLGYDANFNFVIRMYQDGTVSTKDVAKLEASKVKVAPNPTTVSTQLTFDLTEVADEVEVRLLDMTGRIIRSNTYENVMKNTFNVNVKDLATGTYFLSIITPEGYRTEKLVVGK